MAVKDLVQKYESSPLAPLSSSSKRSDFAQESQSSDVQSPEPIKKSESPSTPLEYVSENLNANTISPPRAARFIKHPRESHSDATSHLVNRMPSSPYLNSITDRSVLSSGFAPKSTTLYDNDRFSGSDTSSASLQTPTARSVNLRQLLAGSSTTLVPDGSFDGSLKQREHLYPPLKSDMVENASQGTMEIKSPFHSSRRRHRGHQPVPAPVVFSRDALPLKLPKLDKNLASLPVPFLGGESTDHGGMFPPLDALAKTGRSLDDLENNSTVAPAWRNRLSILGGSINILIGFLVRTYATLLDDIFNVRTQGSSALASFYSLQGLVNTVQIFALILSTIGRLNKRTTLSTFKLKSQNFSSDGRNSCRR